MADIEKKEGAPEKKSANSADKPAPAKKNKPSLKERIGKFFREYKSELKKVVWATPQQTLNNFILVAVSVVITSACIGLLDFAFSTGLTALGRLI